MTSATALFRAAGLLPDGPVLWGAPVRSDRGGVFVVEWAAPLDAAPLDLSPIGRWLERAPGLTLDGRRPSGRELAARLAAFWLPGETVLFVGRTDGALARAVVNLQQTPIGDPAPNPDGRWLLALASSDRMRLWWAETERTEEAEFDLLDAFASGVPETVAVALPDRSVILPFANLAHTLGDRKATGIEADLATAATASPAAGSQSATSEGARSAARAARPARATGATRAGGATRAARVIPRAKAQAPPTAAERRAAEPVHVTAEGLETLRAEHVALRDVRRTAAIKRVAAARELGDLSENAEYHAAREELGFIEGRIRSLEHRLKRAVVIEEPSGVHAAIGSTVIVELDGEAHTFALVGSAEASPGEGRISVSSPVGRALLGRAPGEEVAIRTPGGEQRYRVVEVR